MSTSSDGYTCQSDEVLCVYIASGYQLAEEELVHRYTRLVRICTRPYFLVGGDSEDLIQEGMVGLLYAMRAFDPNRGSLFRSFAEACIRNRILSAIRAASRDKHTPLNQAISFPLEEGDYSPIQINPEDLLISREAYQERLHVLKERLSRFEHTVFHLYLQGLSYEEIATQTNRTAKAVDNAVQRIRRKVGQQLTLCEVSEG